METFHIFGILLLIFLLIDHEVNSNTCAPCSCECRNVYTYTYKAPCLNCTNVNISTIATFPLNFAEKVKTLLLFRKHEFSLENGMFSNFSNLQILSVVSSQFSPSQTLPSRMFQELRNLEQLFLDENRIANVSVDAFEGLRKLKLLYLWDNQIQNIKPRTFRHLPMLEKLELARNEISSISENVFIGLRKLKVLNLYYNQLQVLPTYTFRQLKNLEELYLQSNKISNMSRYAFIGLGKLKELRLSSNGLHTIPPFTLRQLKMLEVLYLGANRHLNISEPVFTGLGKLKLLVLNGNRLRTISPLTFKSLAMLETLNLNQNYISNISEDSFIGLRNLKLLDLSRNQLHTIPPFSFRRLEMLVTLDLSRNKITNMSRNSFGGLISLQSLYSDNNEMQILTCHMFQSLERLEHLDLSGNKIAKILYCSFNGLLKLKELVIRSNELESLQDNVFKDLLNLEWLDMRRNKISTIGDKSLLSLRNLKYIFLTNNNQKSISRSLWITDLSTAILYIERNPFQCSCKLLNEIKQLQYKVNLLIPTAKAFEKHCSNITTTVCEEERNFALGMKVGHNCYDRGYFYHFQSVYAIADGNVSTSANCTRGWWGIPKSCNLYLRIDLPGVIAVTNVELIMNVKYQTWNDRLGKDVYDYENNATMTVEVGDELSDAYERCSDQEYILKSSPSSITTSNVTCRTIPTGREVLVQIRFDEMDEDYCKSFELNVYEITVNGYEENKFNIWSNWSKWGPCSEPCGDGMRLRYRNCTRSTSIACLLPGPINQRSLLHYDNETCYVKSCPDSQAIYQWVIGGVAVVFVLTIFSIIFWYRKFKMVTYCDGLRPNNDFEIDPDRTLLEQIEELPYDLHWEFPRYDVKFESVIGEGNFGRVWLAKAKGIKAFNPRDKSDLSSRAKLAKLQDQRVHEYFTTVTEAWVLGDCDTTHHYDVAVKTLKEDATPKHKIDLASELKLLICMGQHPNIVNVLASCTIRGDLWIIMEYCDHGSLKTFLSDRQKSFNPSWSIQSTDILHEICFFDLLQMCEQVVKGLMFLHWWNVVHRDISSRNILLDANFNVKIADFGLARTDGFIAGVEEIMPIKWTALESLLRHEFTTKSDIWSVAVLFWEIFSFGEMPYPGMSSREVIQQVKEGYRMNSPNHCPEEIWKIISGCWDADPDHRPSAAELFEQLDEVKVSVCSAPAEQYYGTGVDDTTAGTVDELKDLARKKDATTYENAVNENASLTSPNEGANQHRIEMSKNDLINQNLINLKQSIQDVDVADAENIYQRITSALDTMGETKDSTEDENETGL